jgi:hypothetical protein
LRKYGGLEFSFEWLNFDLISTCETKKSPFCKGGFRGDLSGVIRSPRLRVAEPHLKSGAESISKMGITGMNAINELREKLPARNRK